MLRKRVPLAPPDNLAGVPALAHLWREMDEALTPPPAARAELEVACLLMAELRTTTPDQWSPKRFRLLIDLVRGLRR